MKIEEFTQLVTSQGFEVKPKASDHGKFVASKPGFADTEFFELSGHVQIQWPGKHTAQVSTEHWRFER